MKLLKWLLVAVAAMMLSAAVAWANRVPPGQIGTQAHWHGGPAGHGFGHEHHEWHHHHHGAIIFAPALFALPPAFDDPLYAAPAPTVTQPPPVYIERADAGTGGDAAVATPDGVWYYCEATGTYYPYVRECPAGWKTVPAQ